MVRVENIRRLYAPWQPQRSEGDIVYRQFQPTPQLLPYIYCYYEFYSLCPLARPAAFHAVADGCIDMIVPASRNKQRLVVGVSVDSQSFPLGQSFHFYGVRFLPAGFTALTGIAASELSDNSIMLDDVYSEMGNLIDDRDVPLSGVEEVCSSLDSLFVGRLRRYGAMVDNRVVGALSELLLSPNGGITTATLSSRQIRRLFDHYVGDSPKTIARVFRFQKYL